MLRSIAGSKSVPSNYFHAPVYFITDMFAWLVESQESNARSNIDEQLENLVSSIVRFCYRKIFNRPLARYYDSNEKPAFEPHFVCGPDLGSFLYNSDDVAVFVLDALDIWFSKPRFREKPGTETNRCRLHPAGKLWRA